MDDETKTLPTQTAQIWQKWSLDNIFNYRYWI